ncbi:MAG TPA: BLUF domain-containing protein [Sphingomonas sp.]|jgi:hypothetical protein|nr:BLUF domain-containing protein [Sphingomonas sp.]
MRQILYESVSTAPNRRLDLAEIFDRSRHNNALDGVTGLLWADGERFLQVIEGPDDSIANTFGQILLDPRHRDVRVLLDRAIEAREFGAWSMAVRHPGDTDDEFDAHLAQLIERRSLAISDHFRAKLLSD